MAASGDPVERLEAFAKDSDLIFDEAVQHDVAATILEALQVCI